MNPEEANAGAQNGGSAGPIIGTIVILAVIVLGGLYFWGQRSGDEVNVDVDVTEEENNTSTTTPILEVETEVETGANAS